MHTRKSTYLKFFPSLLIFYCSCFALGIVVDKGLLFIGRRLFRYRSGASIRTQNYGIETIDIANEQVQIMRRTVQDMTTCTMWYLLL